MKKKILILGGGIAGLQAAKRLSREQNFDITLVDKGHLHVLKADLYEVATIFPEFVTGDCVSQLRDTVATNFEEVLDSKKVNFICDEVVDIKPAMHYVKLKKGGIKSFDYLLVALGSVTNFFNVPGLKKYGLPLKSVQDALKINCHIDQFFHHIWKSGKKKDVNIVIGGGGATGVEMAAELSQSVDKLCEKFKFKGKVNLSLVQGGNHLAGFEGKGLKIIKDRLNSLGVKVYLETKIVKVRQSDISVRGKKGGMKKLKSDILIWSGGVQVCHVVQKTIGAEERCGAIPVKRNMESMQFKNVFAAGDNAYFMDLRHKDRRLPMLARVAFEQAFVASENMIRRSRAMRLKNYHFVVDVMAIPLGGRYALVQIGPFLLKGFLPWFLRRLIILRYNLRILPVLPACRKWLGSEKIFVLND